MIVDWFDFYRESIKHNWNPNRIFSLLSISIKEVYGKDFEEKCLETLKKIVSYKERSKE